MSAHPAKTLAHRTRLDRRLAFEGLVAKVSADFVAIASEDLGRGMDSTLALMGEFVGADRSYLLEVLPDGVRMSNTYEWCAAGIEQQIDMLQGLPIDMFPWVMGMWAKQAVVNVPDVSTLLAEAQAEREILQAQDIQSVVFVRVLSRSGDFLGFMGFDAVRSQRLWTEEDAYLLRLVSDIISAALERRETDRERAGYRKQLRKLIAELTQSEERERQNLAERLHDGISQELAAARMQLGRLKQDPDTRDAEALGKAVAMLERAIRQAQDVTFELCPPSLHTVGLCAAVRSRGRRLAETHGLTVACEQTGDVRDLSSDMRAMLYRATQELVMNAIKHGEAGEVKVDVAWKKESLELSVHDNGQGFDADHDAHRGESNGGFGLFSIRERLEPFGGRMEIATDFGTRVTLCIPMREQGADTANP